MAGHMATGAVAYRVLKQDSPTTVGKVVALLKKHPYYEEKWKSKLEDLAEDEDQDEYLFMLATRWADDARGDERFYPEGGHIESIHYINLPFKPDGQPTTVQTAPEDQINILRGYAEARKTLSNPNADDEKRAVALCWVLHLIGDAHQPLHTTALFTETFQLKDHGKLVGDRGGTWFFVRANPMAQNGESLHHIWDGFITSKVKYRENRNAVIALMEKPEHVAAKFADELQENDFERWVATSFELAKKYVYYHEGLLLKGGTTRTTPQDLPEGYIKASEAIAKRQGVLAGYRMAATLKTALN